MHNELGSTDSGLSEILGDGCAINCKTPVSPSLFSLPFLVIELECTFFVPSAPR